jgi:hypothetical protein
MILRVPSYFKRASDLFSRCQSLTLSFYFDIESVLALPPVAYRFKLGFLGEIALNIVPGPSFLLAERHILEADATT